MPGCKVSEFDLASVPNEINSKIRFLNKIHLGFSITLAEIWIEFLIKDARCCIKHARCGHRSYLTQQSSKFDERYICFQSTNIWSEVCRCLIMICLWKTIPSLCLSDFENLVVVVLNNFNSKSLHDYKVLFQNLSAVPRNSITFSAMIISKSRRICLKNVIF